MNAVPSSSIDHRATVILDRIAGQGHRLTGPRQALVQILATRDHHFSAQEAWEEVQANGLEIGRATVFRTLDLLTELGILDRVHAGDGCHRYVVCEPVHHHHAMCTDCGRVQPFEGAEVESQIRTLAEAMGFSVITHHLELIGRCAECRAKDL
ncbi:MAG: Fur family transcriptional regulator [Chloroflexota bacterium]